MKHLFFFGCSNNEKGHYWFAPGEGLASDEMVRRSLNIRMELVRSIDNRFLPVDSKQGVYKVSSVPPVIIISWADYTVDSRPGSNSTLVGRGYFGSYEMLEDAQRLFPNFMSRQTILEPEKL
jgi:hypothetical protein